MNKKTFSYSPIAIAIMSACFNVSAQTVSVDQDTTINSTPATDITINDNTILNVTDATAVVIDDPMITLNVGTGAEVMSNQIAVDVQPDADGNSISDPVINNNGIIGGGTIGIRLDRDANSGGTGSLVNISNAENSVIFGGSRALEIEADTIDVENSGLITLTNPNADTTNGVVFVSDQASNVDIFNRDGGVIDSGEGTEAAAIALQLNNGGRRNDITNDEGGEIIGRGNAAASGSDAGDGIRFERERELSSGQDSSGNNLEDIGTLQATTEQFLSQGNVVNAGVISSEGANGTVAGIRVVDSVAFAGTITNETTGVISGEQNGLYFGNADHREIDDAGVVEATGTVSNSGTISSGSRALNIDGSNLQITNEADGQIIGTGNQRNGTVYADSTAQDFVLNNDGLIDAGVGNNGAGFSVELSEEGNDFDINNNGTIQGRGQAGAGLTTAGDGLRFERTRVDGALDGTTTGLFTGDINNGATGIINSESTQGTAAGIRFVNGTSFSGTIENEGTISGAQNGLYFGNATPAGGGDFTGAVVNNSGTISSDSRALNIDGEGLTINNSGSILGTGDQRNGTAYSDGTADNFAFNNLTGGIVDAGAGNIGSGFAAEIGGAADGANTFTLTNAGTIQGRGNGAAATGAAGDGVRIGNAGNTGISEATIVNSGLINSEGANGTVAGLRVVDNVDFQGSLLNEAGGEISGTQNGLYFGIGDHTGSLVTNEGTISSDSRALNIDGEGLTINNSGSILGTGSQRNGTVYADGTATDFTFNNLSTGLVDGGAGNESSAVSIQVGAADGDIQTGSINNEGTLQGRGVDSLSAGIRLFTGTTGATFAGDIINSGDILAEDSAAILIQSGVTLDGSIVNSGNILSTGLTAIDFSENSTGITFEQNDGSIFGNVLLGSGDDAFNINGGSVSGSITGQDSGVVNVDIGAGNTFISNGVFDVQDYNILSGTVNQVGDFSTTNATTTVSSGATLNFDSTINGSGALVSNGTLSFGPDGRLIQNGDVTLNGGSTVAFLFDTALEAGDEVTLINATSITDNGVSIVDNSVLLDLESTLDGNGNLIVQTVNADLVDGVVVGGVVLDENTQEFATALGQTLAQGNPDLLANVAELQSAGIDDLTALTPSLSGAATLGAYQLNDAVLNLVRNQYASGNATSELKNGLWINALSGSADQDNANGISGFDNDYDGFGVGYSIQLDHTRIGIAYNYSDAEIRNNLGDSIDTDIDSNQITAFADYQAKNWFFGGSLSYSDLEYDFSRASTLNGLNAVSANTDGSLFDASINAGYKFKASSINITPIASIAYSSLDIDSFNETGGVGITDVSFADVDRLRSELGVLFSADKKYGDWTISPSLKLAWEHDFNDDATELSAQVGGVSFNQIGNELETDVVNVGAGVSFKNDNGWNFRFGYQGEFASDEDNQFGSASVEYRF